MEKIFGKDGLLSRVLEDYEYRSVQETMALEVRGAISEGRASIIEAGTGTGKTLAYLIPQKAHIAAISGGMHER
jgi:ATP-dependent DNA helicase DinG